jgi:arginyl-tRNA synthetase
MSLAIRVREAIESALESIGLGEHVASATWTLERPKRAEHGDLATNVALAITKKAGRPPRQIAEELVKALGSSDVIASADIAGPGFVNLRLRPSVFHAELADVLHAGRAWGRAPAGTGERVNVEFVSANPTGPVTVASGRNAVLGDAIARLLEASGARVTREYYINDRGNQVLMLAESVKAAATGKEPPADGYKGAYVSELATWLVNVDPETLAGPSEALGRLSTATMLRGIPGSRVLRGIKTSLADLGVYFDVWFSEESLHRWGGVDAVMRQLEAGGFLEHKDGALVFKAPEGAVEDKDKSGATVDRVLKKSDGTWTYFASDIAYIADKIGRGFERLVYVLGADHHGTMPRLKNAMLALGLPVDRFQPTLYQLVFITKGGEAFKSSKREGKFVTVDEVMDEIDDAAGRKGAGADALRFFFLLRSSNSNVDFDVELAKKASDDNPVFYVQYGHARLCSILRKAAEIGIVTPTHLSPADWAHLVHPDELALAHKLGDFPDLVSEAAKLREPHRVAFYVQELARDFQSYFTRLKGVDGKADPILPPRSVRERPGWEKDWDFGKTRARLAWVAAIRDVYAAALDLLGVSAPERMERPRPAEGVDAADAAVGDEVADD